METYSQYSSGTYYAEWVTHFAPRFGENGKVFFIMNNVKQTIFKKGEAKVPHDAAYAIVYIYPTRIEITAMDNKPGKNSKLPHFKKCSNKTYINRDSGEIMEYKKAENRLNSHYSLSKSLKSLRRLINCNFVGDKNELFVTLTYGGACAGKMYDTNKLYHDFKTFWQRLSYKNPSLEYICIPEPHEDGAWHIHLLLRGRDGQSLYISNEEMAEIWSHGFVKVERLTTPERLVSYFYKGGITERKVKDEVFDGADDNEKFISGISKAHKNFNRFHLYPPGFNLYRCSNGICQPIKERMTYKQAKALIPSDAQFLNSSTTRVCVVEDEAGEAKEVNAITHFNYKLPENSTRRAVHKVLFAAAEVLKRKDDYNDNQVK